MKQATIAKMYAGYKKRFSKTPEPHKKMA